LGGVEAVMKEVWIAAWGRAKNGAVGVMVLPRGKLMVLGQEVDLRGQWGTVGKLRVSSTRWDG
jgi:hypothetical protein